MSSKKFIQKFLGITLVVYTLMGAFMYVIDPWLYYRINPKNNYWLDGGFVSSGLAKNVEYDTAIIGSSYFQNFDMDWFRNKLDWQPVNLTVPGLDLLESEMIINKVLKEDKADRLVISLTDYTFEGTLQDKNRMPKYLFDDNKVNDLEYLYSYDAWMKFLPLDLATKLIDKITPVFSEKFASMMDIDELGNRMQNYVYDKEVVIKQYKDLFKTRERVKDTQKAYEMMKNNFYSYIDNIGIKENPDKEYIFVLPPYSSLYWHMMEEENKLEHYEKFERLMVEAFAKYPNVKVVDTYDMEGTKNLDNYRDVTHFNTDMQEEIVDYINSDKHYLTKENIDEKQEYIRNLIKEFQAENSSWLILNKQ